MNEVMKIIPPPLKEHIVSIAKVGSRETCNPAPMDTDIDVLILVKESTDDDNIFGIVDQFGMSHDGSDVNNPFGEDAFQSFRINEYNLILTKDMNFFDKFISATSVAKRLNLMDKSDRVALFQAVLYGNPCLPINIRYGCS